MLKPRYRKVKELPEAAPDWMSADDPYLRTRECCDVETISLDTSGEQNSDCDSETSKVIKRLKGPIFERPYEPSIVYWAVTINPAPTKSLNKKPYQQYSHDQQRAILTRMELASRKTITRVHLEALTFEVAPMLQTIHLHALYSGEKETFEKQIREYWDKRLQDPSALEQWRHIDVQEVYDKQRWIEYIRKDII